MDSFLLNLQTNMERKMFQRIVITFSFLFFVVVQSLSAQTLRYMMWDPSQLEIEKATIAKFESANPGVKIEVSAMPPKEYWPRISALAACIRRLLPYALWFVCCNSTCGCACSAFGSC